MSSLHGTNADAREMLKTFEFLNYTVHQLQNNNATGEEIKKKVLSISKDLKKYDGHMKDKVIVFAFSGHGTNKEENEHIYGNDGVLLCLSDDIIKPLVEVKAVDKIPKVF